MLELSKNRTSRVTTNRFEFLLTGTLVYCSQYYTSGNNDNVILSLKVERRNKSPPPNQLWI